MMFWKGVVQCVDSMQEEASRKADVEATQAQDGLEGARALAAPCRSITWRGAARSFMRSGYSNECSYISFFQEWEISLLLAVLQCPKGRAMVHTCVCDKGVIMIHRDDMEVS